MKSGDRCIEQLLARAGHYTARARTQLRYNRTTEARLYTRRAVCLLEQAANARVASAIAILESNSTRKPNQS